MPPRLVSDKTMLDITIQGDIGGQSIAFEDHVSVDASEDDLNHRVDLLTRVFNRQIARNDLRQKMLDLDMARQVLAALPEEKQQTIRNRAEDRARLVASFHASHEAAGRRSDFKMTTQQKTALQGHDDATKSEIAKADEKPAKTERGIAFLEGEIARLRGIIAGADPLSDKGEPLAVAAE